MTVNLKGRSFLTLMDYSPEEIRYLLDLAAKLKKDRAAGVFGDSLRGRNVLLLFEKTSTRTRSAFEVGATQEGGNVTFLDNRNSQFGKKESVEDSAKVFGRIYDAIEYRGFEQSVVEDLAKHSGVPVYNGLTDIDHPTQILADLMTIEEHIDKPLSDVKLVFCGDTRNNMSYAWMYGCAKMGMTFVAYGPAERAPEQAVFDRIAPVCEQTGASVIFSSDVGDLAGADAVYTDIWASMGEEDQIPDRVKLLTPYKVTDRLLEATGNPDVLFMHCLPAFHDFETDLARSQYDLGYDIREVTDEVFRSEHSVVFDEAENRMHTIKAIMVATIGRPDPSR
ncbi:MAG: ornithine carbamoyltransferase [Clostridiales Family XIII bacterium]|jgi:ornithine carbamoyltransferase|nr:ornithine carbamoyltransferase [Clostridiales Family XIII bacterium]